MSKRAPINTAREHDPLALLVNAMALGSGGAIEHQEAQGQRSFVNSDTLPTDMRPGAKEALEACGFKFLGPVEGDPMFQYVEMPEGWSKKPTDHSMWSKLVDPQGRERGGIFYKAAFYDRSAHMNLDCRYGFRKDYDRKDAAVVNVTDCEKTIHTITVALSEHKDEWAAGDAAYDAAKAWLNDRYPDWQNSAAYWD